MKSPRFLPLPLRRLLRDRRGATALMVAGMVPTLLGAAGLAVDFGRALVAKNALASSTQAAALAGAYALGTSGSAAVSGAVTTWTTAHPVANVTVTATTPNTLCTTAATGLPPCSATEHNAVSVTRTGTVSTFFLRVLGRSDFHLTATATAVKAGGSVKPLNVMFVLDATGSMDTADSSCIVPTFNDNDTPAKNRKSPTRFQCALYSIQSVLKVMPTAADKVGLMIFPGTSTQYSPTSGSCGTQPPSVPYLTTGIKYQIGTALDNTYNDGNLALLTSSQMVAAVGIYAKTGAATPCVTNKGGQGSYAAEVITKAHAALPVVEGTQNVIVFLSDGDFGTDSNHFADGKKKDHQCKLAVDAAKTASTAVTGKAKIYSVAYGAQTTGCAKDAAPTSTYKPCSTMKDIASDSTTFYSTSATCSINGSLNPVTQLPDIFKAITTSLTKPRLIN